MDVRLAALALLVLVTGCSDDKSCVVNDECFAGEACIDDVCQRASQGDDPDGGLTADRDSSSDTGPVGDQLDFAGDGDSPTGTCRASQFDSCPGDSDASRAEYLNGDFGQGCPAPDDDFGAGVITVNRSICPLEASDRYDTTVTRCDTAVFFVDVDVLPTEMCAPSDWTFNASYDGNDCAEPNGLVECADLPNGGKRATLIIEPGSAFHSLYTTIESAAENLRFDYELKITFRQ